MLDDPAPLEIVVLFKQLRASTLVVYLQQGVVIRVQKLVVQLPFGIGMAARLPVMGGSAVQNRRNPFIPCLGTAYVDLDEKPALRSAALVTKCPLTLGQNFPQPVLKIVHGSIPFYHCTTHPDGTPEL